MAQKLSSAVRLFLGEFHYNTGVGLPYFQDILQGAILPIRDGKFASCGIVSASGHERLRDNCICRWALWTGQIQFTTLDDHNLPSVILC